MDEDGLPAGPAVAGSGTSGDVDRRPPAPVGPASIQAGQWWYDPAGARFVYSKAPGVTVLPSFDAARDRVDLGGRGLDFESLHPRITDLAWATEVTLDGTPGTVGEDRLLVKGLRPADLCPENFIF